MEQDPPPIERDPPPIELVEIPDPVAGAGHLLVRVAACGVCRTDLHVIEGDLPTHRENVVPGHEVVGRVERVGPGVRGWQVGDRVGVAWLRSTCGRCRWCVRGMENLCPKASFTGWDADGGYAELTAVPADFAYHLPEGPSDVELAPLLCAGIIGYRALRRSGLPLRGRLGLYGFGGSAHLTAQVAIAEGARVHVMTRGEDAQRLALHLGAESAQGAYDPPPEPLDAAILFAPVGELVPTALQALDRGGVLAIAGIHLSDVPPLGYERDLFYEREIRTVTANTRADGHALLRIAAASHVRATTHPYPFERAVDALRDLRAGRFDGAAVLVMDEPGAPPG
ncbi:UNVERIFIED_CONTAM: alcohol dehydrogenase [Mumia flava]